MGRIISYYKPPVIEYLSEHIDNCINLLEKLESSRIGRVGLSLDENFIDEVRLSVVFHDLGKVFYQRYPVSFAGHEIFSSYFLFKFRKLIMVEGLDYLKGLNVLKPALFAVAFHHHPMDVMKRLERVNRVKLDSGFLEDLRNELSLMRGDALSREERDLLDSVIIELKAGIDSGSIKISDIKRIFGDIREDLYGNYISGGEKDIILKKLSYLTLVSLVSIDYISASKRGSERTKFNDVVDEFYKLYLST